VAIEFLIKQVAFSISLEGSQPAGQGFTVERLTLSSSSGRISAPVSVGAPVVASPGADLLMPRPWSFGASAFSFEFPAGRLDVAGSNGSITFQCDRLTATCQADTLTLNVTGLRITSQRLPGFLILADATLQIKNGALQSSSGIQLHQPHRSAGTLTAGAGTVSLEWTTDVLGALPLPGLEALLEGGEDVTLTLTGPFNTLNLSTTARRNVIGQSAFAWMRGSDRELLPPPKTDGTPALAMQLTVHGPDNSRKLRLMGMDLTSGALPAFFVDDSSGGPLASNWSPQLTITQFDFPFLKATDQAITVTGFTSSGAVSSGALPGTLALTIQVGASNADLPLQGFEFSAQANVGFIISNFAFADVENAQGITILADSTPTTQVGVVSGTDPGAATSALGPRNLLGLTWHFHPAPGAATTGFVPLFVLATINSHYQLKLAPNCSVTAGYARLTHGTELVEFDSTDFALTEGGLNLTAKVRNQPVLLYGLNTRFRFHDTVLTVIDGTIQDFTLIGTGALPPALVGDAAVEAAIQFQQQGDSLVVASGGAQLKGLHPIEFKPIRFRFSIDSLGLKFVDDGRYHFYFTLSGHAQFVLQPGDDPDGPLAALTEIQIPLLDVALAGETSVLSDHVDFLSHLTEDREFKFLKAFTFQLKGFGFLPAADEFGGDPAIKLSGQMLFSADNDKKSAKIDFHDLLIGLPEDGENFPRLFVRELGVEIKYGEAFELTGSVEFIKSKLESGFKGEGTLQIKSLPQIAASFGFVRVRQDETSPYQKAWFVFLEVDKVSFQIPEVELYLREVGLGFGFRFTLAAIQAADRQTDLDTLISSLNTLSKTAGNLSKKDQWVTDLEAPGEDPRWTIVFRALFTQTSASTSPLKYDEDKEKDLPCVYLFDAIVAFRSDLTFFMSARGWINTNYADFLDTETNDITGKPMVTGFIILQTRQKRFLAHVASQPDGELGQHPDTPDFVKDAIKGTQFSATLLIEPGLFHLELGWPNMLRWTRKFGPVDVEFRGGFIFRIVERITVSKTIQDGDLPTQTVPGFRFSETAGLRRLEWDNPNTSQEAVILTLLPQTARNVSSFQQGVKDLLPPWGPDVTVTGDVFMVLGISFQARAHLEINEGFDAVVFGAQLHATVDAAFGARMTGVTSLIRTDEVAVYAAITFELRAEFDLTLWVGLSKKLSKSFSFSLSLTITASLEIGLVSTTAGVRGSGTVTVRLMGHDLHFHAHFEVNSSTIDDALRLTNDFLVLGLDATDVEGAPAAPSGGTSSPQAPPTIGNDPLTPVPVVPPAPVPVPVVVSGGPPPPTTTVLGHAPTAPQYTMLVNSVDSVGAYVLLMPRGELDTGGTETGFLPGPPPGGASNDFQVHFPSSVQQVGAGNNLTASSTDFSWTAAWGFVDPVSGIKVSDYLVSAFIHNPDGSLTDPNALPSAANVLRDSRVQNPTDSSYEAAVRGAFQQFRGSPFFKTDPNNPYDQSLTKAFSSSTSIYSESGGPPTADDRLVEQVIHTRGLIIHDLVGGFNDFVQAIKQGRTQDAAGLAQTLPFQMGLVFLVPPTSQPPSWLTGSAGVNISQRVAVAATLATAATGATVFNLPAANFNVFPPSFDNVRHYTSSNTIAIAWDLGWDRVPSGATGLQMDPEHHLLNYQVRRRALDGSEPEAAYSVKAAQVLHKEAAGVLNRLTPRFQVVDHFNHETLADQAALPVGGRSYLYTITPMDVAGNPGRPLTLVATRFPDEPPQVPAGAELSVTYQLDSTVLDPAKAGSPSAPPLLLSQSGPPAANVTWKEPLPGSGPAVPIETYQLIFRKDRTLPVGSYGLDSSTQGPRSKSLPTSNARTLPTDILVPLSPDGPRTARTSPVDLSKVFPPGSNPLWRPEAWTVFFQTVSANGVPSALAPVQLLLQFASGSAVEERRPSELEFVAAPLQIPLLPAEDMQAETGDECVPAPPDTSSGTGTYIKNPEGGRLIRFHWNQGPSGAARYPLNLNAGYRLLQMDIDTQTLQTVQEVQMLPPEDVSLAPNGTRSTGLWTAWYPSTMQRIRNIRSSPAIPGSESPFGAWNSWRESCLVWPEWPGFNGAGAVAAVRPQMLHPALQAIVDRLKLNFQVDVQLAPPMQPGTLDSLMSATAEGPDPYGWGILQRFGLSVTVTLRLSDGTLVSGKDAADAILARLQPPAQSTSPAPPDIVSTFRSFLHVELLYQPGRSVSLKEVTVDPSTQLAIVQLSLRPGFQSQFAYSRAVLPVTMKATISPQALTPGAATTVVLNAPEATFDSRFVTVQFAAPGVDVSQVTVTPPGTLTFTATAPAGSNVQASSLRILASSTSIPVSATSPADVRVFSTQDGANFTLQPIEASEDVTFTLQPNTACTLIDPADPASGEVQITAGQPATPVTRTFKIPAKGQAVLLLRAPATPSGGTSPVTLAAGPDGCRVAIQQTPFPASDPSSLYFSVPAQSLAARFAAGDPDWLRFKSYAESLNPNPLDQADPSLSIQVPTDAAGIQAILPQYLAWTTRFFDYSATAEASAAANPGPWMATAYPHSDSPVYVTPDAAGRLTYDLRVTDPWAHNYRYYIQPFGRYDLLWQGLRQSRKFSPSTAAASVLVSPGPDPQKPALDVVLDRRRRVAAPVVLSSRRLDGPPTTANPSGVIGPTWEVIVQQHPEQALMERNQTVFRQLSYRGITFTLLRQFAFLAWMRTLLGQASAQPLNPVDANPAIPSSYPATPDHLDLSRLTADQQRALDIGQRLGGSLQGAMVLHWDALPFYYRHRLLLAAQTDTQVSEVTEVIQADFEYQSPAPEGRFQGGDAQWTLPAPFSQPANLRSLRLEVPLKRLWDCLPQAAQNAWPHEQPDPHDTARRPGAVPDPEVVYQIVEQFSGNIELQAEFSSDSQAYQVRQIGKRYLASLDAAPNPAPPALASDFFVLGSFLLPVAELALSKAYNTGGFLTFAAQQTHLLIAGIPSPANVDALIRGNITVNNAGEVVGMVASSPPVPAALAAKVRYPDIPAGDDIPALLNNQLAIDTIGVTWTGAMSTAQKTALQAYRADSRLFQSAVSSIITQLGSRQLIALARTISNTAISHKLQIDVVLPPDPLANWTLTWTGGLSTSDQVALNGLSANDADWAGAIAGLTTAAQAQVTGQADGDQMPSSTAPSVPGFSVTLTSVPVSPGSAQTKQVRQMTWSPADPDQKAAIRALLPDSNFQAAVNAMFTSLDQRTSSFVVGGPFRYPTPTRTIPSPLPPTVANQLRIDKVFPPDPAAKWTLSWTGALGASDKAALNGLSSNDVDWASAIDGLATAAQASVSGQADGDQLPATPPTGFSVTLAAVPVGADSTQTKQVRQITWSPADPDQKAAILALLPADTNFQAALNAMFVSLDQRTSSVDVGGPFRYPAVNPAELATQIGYPQIGAVMTVTSQAIQWNGQLDRLEVPFSQLASRIAAFLHPGDPFLAAFANLSGPFALTAAYSGSRPIAAAALLTPQELPTLQGIFGGVEDAAITALANDLQDRAKIAAESDSWFSTEAFSFLQFAIPPSLSSRIEPVDADSCTLVWKGPLSAADRTVLTSLGGDELFQAALSQLKDGGVSFSHAPLALDQVPSLLRPNITIGSGRAGFTWTGLLTDQKVTALRNWAQTAELAAAVNQIIAAADLKTTTVTLPPEIPPHLSPGLQIGAAQKAWIGLPPTNPDDNAALQAILTVPPTPPHAVTTLDGTFQPRPTQAQLPRLIRMRLTIGDTQVSWTGRANDQRQIDALLALTGDAAFVQAIGQIVSQLTGFTMTVGGVIPRPVQISLPPGIRDRLLIGNLRLRYRGLMSQQECHDLQQAFPSQADKDAAERLYLASLETVKQGRAPKIRARRASAAPSALIDLSPKPIQ